MSLIIITGASSGVGRALSLHFAGKGETVCALARSVDKLKEIAARFPENITAYPTDISDSSQVQRTFDAIAHQQGIADVLINNASVHMNEYFVNLDTDFIDRMIDINIKGMLYCTHAVLPGMIDNKNGRIVNISSVGGLRGAPKRTLYIASKHAMVGFGDALAQELMQHGILLITLCPGGIATPLWDEEKNPYRGDTSKLIKPEEMAELIDYLLHQPKHIVYKKLVFFPTTEWHSL